MRKLMMLLLAMGSVVLVGCGVGQVEISRDRGSDVFNVTVELNEDDIAQLVEQALAASGNPLLRNPQVDLQEGQIEITGSHERRDGEGEVNGRIVIVPSIQDGVLIIEVVEVDIEGVPVSDDRIEQFNQNLTQRIQRRLERRNHDITMTGVDVADNLMTITFDASRRNNN